jgi:hypothetical protein
MMTLKVVRNREVRVFSSVPSALEAVADLTIAWCSLHAGSAIGIYPGQHFASMWKNVWRILNCRRQTHPPFRNRPVLCPDFSWAKQFLVPCDFGKGGSCEGGFAVENIVSPCKPFGSTEEQQTTHDDLHGVWNALGSGRLQLMDVGTNADGSILVPEGLEQSLTWQGSDTLFVLALDTGHRDVMSELLLGNTSEMGMMVGSETPNIIVFTVPNTLSSMADQRRSLEGAGWTITLDGGTEFLL